MRKSLPEELCGPRDGPHEIALFEKSGGARRCAITDGRLTTVRVADLADEIAALYRSIRLLRAAFSMLDDAMAKGA